MALFKDRSQAGKQLATVLSTTQERRYDIVLALARGGVPIAYEIAQMLHLPLDVFIVRKLGVPWHEELAMGAITSGGISILNDDLIDRFNISQDDILACIDKEVKELNRREITYRGNKEKISFSGKNILLVDDGVATGASMKVAIIALKKTKPASITAAVPVGEASSLKKLKDIVNELVCPNIPEIFYGVGQWYESFPPVSDQEVCKLLSMPDTHD